MSQPVLTSLDSVKAWLDVTTTTDDQLLWRLMQQVSRNILSYIQRPDIFQATYSDVYDGSGQSRQMLRNWPVTSVASVTVGTSSVTKASAFGQSGWRLSPWDGYPPGNPQWIDLTGSIFWRGHSNVAVTYTAGYVIENEPQTVPSTANYERRVNAPYGNWAVDQGVAYANGTPLTPVTGTPSAGQYAVAKGIYTFASADANAAVLISYSFVPADIEEACIDTVAEQYRYKERIGEKTKTLAGQETGAYDTTRLTAFTKQQLQPYMRVFYR